MGWGDDLADWWVGEVEGDPAYEETVVPLAEAAIAARAGQTWLDLGCGEGRMMRRLGESGVTVIGCDSSPALASRAAESGPAVVGALPDLAWLADSCVDGAFAVLVLEHLDNLPTLFSEAARVVRPGGTLAVVANHPVMTAVGSAPVYDQSDGEILWRWGDYFGAGSTEEPAGRGVVAFVHRSLATLLNAGAAAGWGLEWAREAGVGEAQAGRDHLLALQRNIPRLLALRWRKGV